MCRYHATQRAAAAVYKGGWVLLCGACANAVRGQALEIVGPDGAYQGYLPLLPDH